MTGLLCVVVGVSRVLRFAQGLKVVAVEKATARDLLVANFSVQCFEEHGDARLAADFGGGGERSPGVVRLSGLDLLGGLVRDSHRRTLVGYELGLECARNDAQAQRTLSLCSLLILVKYSIEHAKETARQRVRRPRPARP